VLVARLLPVDGGGKLRASPDTGGGEPRGVEWAEIDRRGHTLGDQLGYRLARGGRIEDPPGAMARGDIATGHAGHAADERQPVGDGRSQACWRVIGAATSEFATRAAARARMAQEASFTSTAFGESGSGAGSAIPRT